MTAQVRIATASKDLFESLRLSLVRAGIGFEIEAQRLADGQEVLEWLESGTRTLLVLDSLLPKVNGEGEYGTGYAAELLHELRSRGIRTPVLVIMQGFDPDLERECNPDNLAIALPHEKLKHRARVVKPFMAMLMGRPDDGAEGSPAIPGTFRVIEVDFHHDRSVCSLGFDDKPDDLIEWRHTRSLHDIKTVAHVFSPMNAYDERGWIDKVRLGGEAVFGRHVMRAIGTGLFRHIEQAAGGLHRLSFRYGISDPALYPAPFEGSLRGNDDGHDGLFVLLNAPVVRRLPRPQVIRVSRHRTARLPSRVRILFIRSQMSEHPEGRTEKDRLVVQDEGQNKTLLFPRLASIDVELEHMTTLAAAVGRDRMELEPLNLSDFQTAEKGGALECIRSKLRNEKYDLVHYAGHAWSNGFSGRESNLLVLPGATLGQAVSLPIDELAELAAKAEARFVYLSACRGTSTRSVQSFVAQGVPHALGFRCNVEDVRAAAFARTFYTSLFGTNSSFCHSFREACASARRDLVTDEESPIWVTPIMLAQSPDWAMRH